MGEYAEPALRYFNAKVEVKDLRQTLDEMETIGIKRVVILPIDSTTFLGRGIPNRLIGEIRDPRVVKFVSVDPLKQSAQEELEKAIKEIEPQGVKFHPQLQGFHPLDERAMKLYEVVERHGLIAVFHTGTSGIGAGVRSGIRLDYGRPIYFDEIAVRFPELKIVLAHFGWPWTEEALAIALHKPNVYVDLSGWAPKYIPRAVWDNAKRLSEKLLFGSDFPLVSPQRWLKEFEAIPLDGDIKRKIMKGNAEKLLR
ncbi:amidohydrolase [Stygiolobus caldivivus]|uniref:Amidohydrolase n=1 Tax=Stygiolobus caldivivus TaxID=2824673 RepID=A0A8D5U6C4_9CREN|nr:amidohydrolase family protein [Stygiolobus caldivivus]BCU69654.1 amidohydrolase [Stygiolobus caldivivus]